MNNRNSIMPEDYEEFISLTLRTRNWKKPSRMLARSWKRRWLLQCFARQARHVSMAWPVAKSMSSNQKLRASWKPVNPQDCIWKKSLPDYHEDHIAGKGVNSLQHYNLVHKFIPLPQAMKIPEAKAAVDEEWEKLEKIPACDLTQDRRKRWSTKQRRRAQKFILPHWWTSFIWRMPNWKMQRSSCTPRRYCERWFWILCSIYKTRIISITNDRSKSHEFHVQTAGVRRTSSWRSICLYPGESGRCSKIIENSQVGMSRH